MLNRLNIHNVALIDEAEIEFCAGLNVLSGETGSGKSVILDSVNFVLGAKADKSMIRYGRNECSVSAEFDITGNESVQRELEEMELAVDDLLVIQRKFTQEGRSSIRINGVPANGAMLRRLTGHLVDVHGQSEHFFLLKESNQLKVLDDAAGEELLALKEQLAAKTAALREDKKRLDRLGADDGERNRRLDILSFQIEEIEKAELKDGEEDELLARRAKMNAVEKILSALQEAEEALTADGAGTDALRTAARAMSGIASLDPAYTEACERLENLQAEAEDLADTLSSLGEEVYFDENERTETENRLDEIKRLKRKYGPQIKDVLAFLDKAREEYDMLSHSGEEAERIKSAMEKCRKEIYALCGRLTDVRKKTAADFTARVVAELKTLNIPSARFETEFAPYTATDADRATANGLDEVRFLFSANAGEPLKPLSKIISGGEMSRFMLAVKTQLSGVNGISTYIFDEIDAGISGKTAKVVAEKFAMIARNTQIIAVSHLAQIVCMADRDFLIRKEENADKTCTKVLRLSDEERVAELVRLLGGDAGSEFAEKHAKEMIDSAKKLKNILSQNA